MIRAEIFQELFKVAIDEASDLSIEEKTTLSDALAYDLHNGISYMQSKTQFVYLSNLFDFLKRSSLDFDEDVDYSHLDSYVNETFVDINKKRMFAYKEHSLMVANTDSLGNTILDNVFYVIEALASIESHRTDLLNLIRSNAPDQYVLLFDAVQFNGTGIDLYSYAYLKYLETEKIEIDSDLIWDWNTSVSTINTGFSSTVIYSQYYDVYDVINEWHHANDVLVAFLKMYQVLEYMGYRRKMVDVVKGSDIKNSFLMHVKSLNSSFNERTALRELFLHDIESFKDKFTKIDSNVTAFIRKYWLHDGKNPYLQVTDATTPKASINPKIATFIYDVRCAIVHNKESEFHITYNNIDKYRCLLPLMKEILSLMPGIIMRCLNKHNVGISYSVKELKLY